MATFKTLYLISAAEQVKAKNPNHEAEQKMLTAMNAKPAAGKASELSPEDKKEIGVKFRDLYFGLTWLNWMQGGATLGQAWHGALSQVDGIVQTKVQQHPDNPAAKHLQQIAAEHKKHWSQVIMTSKHSGEKMDVPPDKSAEWQKIGEKAGRDGLDGLNAKIKASEPKAQGRNNEAGGIVRMFPGGPGKGNIIDMALWNQRQRQAG